MSPALKKFEQQAISSGFAAAVHTVPGRDADHSHLAIVLQDAPPPIKFRKLKAGEQLEEGTVPVDPVDQAKTLLKEAGLIHGEVRYFLAAKSPAVTVFDVGIPAAVASKPKPEPKA